MSLVRAPGRSARRLHDGVVMANRYVTAAIIAVTVGLPYSPTVASPDAGASTSEWRGAIEPAPNVNRVLAPKAPAQEEALAAMRREMDQLRLQLAQQQSRVAALEAEVANEEARRAHEADETNARQRDLRAIISILAEIDRRLATGSGQVSDELARAQATAASVASSAAAAGSALQSGHASSAQSWLAASQEALARGDLFEARLAVNRAAGCVRAAALATAVPGPDGRGVRDD